jgi:hypothetical protein
MLFSSGLRNTPNLHINISDFKQSVTIKLENATNDDFLVENVLVTTAKDGICKVCRTYVVHTRCPARREEFIIVCAVDFAIFGGKYAMEVFGDS